MNERCDSVQVLFTASDDALAGYPLSTYTVDMSTSALSLMSASGYTAVDMYFNRAVLDQNWHGHDPPSLASGASVFKIKQNHFLDNEIQRVFY